MDMVTVLLFPHKLTIADTGGGVTHTTTITVTIQ